jgi:hypothetical protein
MPRIGPSGHRVLLAAQPRTPFPRYFGGSAAELEPPERAGFRERVRKPVKERFERFAPLAKASKPQERLSAAPDGQ